MVVVLKMDGVLLRLIVCALSWFVACGFSPYATPRLSFARHSYYGNQNVRNSRSNIDPSIKLSFKKTVKIDPTVRTPLSDMKFSAKTLDVLQKKGFRDMTPVQSQCYDQVFSGDDVVARSKTGTGKTLAFGLPLIEALVSKGMNTNPPGTPLIVILEPTRELANQVADELEVVSRAHGMKTLCVYGGASMVTQEMALRGTVHILVATPGRLLDHISRGTVDLSHVQHVVLDEGDTMLEMGFQQAVESILLNVKRPGESSRRVASSALDKFDSGGAYRDQGDNQPEKSVQMLLFSATMPGWICEMTKKHMDDPIFLDAVADGETRLADTIAHYAMKISSYDRMSHIIRSIEDVILTKGAGGQAIVFVNKKSDADMLANSGAFKQLRSQVLHGDISQYTRQHTIRTFKEKKIDVLIATDVAARGLDIAGVDLVVHASPPNDPDFFVHRSGRTGRAGRNGTSIMLYGNEDGPKLQQFERLLFFRFQELLPPSQADISRATCLIAEKKIAEVNYEVVAHHLPQAKALLKRTIEEGGEDSVEVLLAKCLAAINNRQSVPTR